MPTEWQCPNCEWKQTAHPTYGWSKTDEHAVEIHQTILCPNRKVEKQSSDDLFYFVYDPTWCRVEMIRNNTEEFVAELACEFPSAIYFAGSIDTDVVC